MIKYININSASTDIKIKKQPYSKPELVVFGKVSALTLGQSGCDKNDNACTTVSGTMGSKVQTSDRNLKENIVRIGEHPLGVGLYLFNYKLQYQQPWGQGRQFGVMAQEVEALLPEAVCVHPDGHKMVDYAMLGITQTVH